MDIFEEYALHDTRLNGITICDDGIELLFCEGVYKTDEKGKELFLTPECTIKFSICDFDQKNYYRHITVSKIKKNKIFETDLLKLICLLKEAPLDIDMQYYSVFSNAVLIRGTIGKCKFDFEITEISEVAFLFK